MYLKIYFNLYLLLMVTCLMMACGKDDPQEMPQGMDDPVDDPDPTDSTANTQVTVLYAADIGNNGNGSDLRIDFEKAIAEDDVTEYRIIVTPAESGFEFNAEQAEQLDPGRFVGVEPTGQDQQVRLSESLFDSNGNLITEGRNYRIYILSIGKTPRSTTLSPPSADIELAKTNIVLSLTEAINAATGGIVIDSEGNIFMADIGLAPNRNGNTIYKIDPLGEVSVFVSGSQLLGPSGNAMDTQGNLFQSNLGLNNIVKIDPSGEISIFTSTSLNAPVGIAIDNENNLFVANCGNNNIVKVTPEGSTSTFASDNQFNCPNGITLDDNQNLYVANFGDGNILKITPQGNTSLFARLPGGNNGHIIFQEGKFYAAARSAHRLYEIDLDGNIKVLAGSGIQGMYDGAARQARLSLPNDLVFSRDGKTLFVNHVFSDSGNSNRPSIIRKILIEE